MIPQTPQQLAEAERRITHDITRRHFFGRCGVGLGALALNQLLSADGFGASPKIDPARPMSPRVPHFPAKAKNVIFLFMAGGPSQLAVYPDGWHLLLRDLDWATTMADLTAWLAATGGPLPSGFEGIKPLDETSCLELVGEGSA